MNKTDPRIAKTLQSIQLASAEILTHEGWSALTISAICKKAKISRSTFYDHFENIQDPLGEFVLQSFLEEYSDFARGDQSLDPESLLIGGKPLSWMLFDHAWKHRELYRLLMMPQGGCIWPRLLDNIAHYSHQLHAPLRKISNSPQDPERIASYLSGALLGTLRWWLNSSDPPNSIQMAYWFSAMAAPGLLELEGIPFNE